MIVTIYAGAVGGLDGQPPADVVDLTWDELCEELSAIVDRLPDAPATAPPAAQKRAMLAWSPHALREGTTRLLENVEAVTLLVVDVDAGADPEAVAEALDAHGWAGFIYASPSDTPEARRFRVVSPIVDPIPPEECRATRIAFAEALGLAPGCGVEGAIDASKLFFAGRLHGTPDREIWRVDGAPVDAARLPAPRLAWGKAKAPATLTPLEALPPADAGIATALGHWEAHDGRKWDLCGAVGGVMRKAGYSAAQCEAEIRAWLPPDDPGVDVNAGVKHALGAWAKSREDVSGHEALAQLVGAQHAEIVGEAVRAGSWIGRWAARREARRAERRPLGTPGEGWARPRAAEDPNAPFATSDFSEDAPVDYYCEGLRLAPSDGKISLLAGLPGAGKGPIADHLGVCFALGLPAFGRFACQKRRTLLLDGEGLRLAKRRIRRMVLALGHEPSALHGELLTRDVSADDMISASFLDRLAAEIEAQGVDVVILDSYTSAMLATGLDPNKVEWASLAKALGSLDVLVIAVAHARKLPDRSERPTLGDVAGSFALSALAATGICVYHPDEDDLARVRVACMRAPETGFPQFEVTFTDTLEGAGLALEVVTAEEAKQDEQSSEAGQRATIAGRLLAHLRAVHMPRTKRKIEEATGIHHRHTSAVLPELVAAGFVALQAGVGSRPDMYLATGNAPDHVAVDAAGAIVPAPPAAAYVGPFRRRG